MKHPKTKEEILAKDKKITRRVLEQMEKAGIKDVPVEREMLDGAVLLQDIVNMGTGEVLMEANEPFLQTHLEMFLANDIQSFDVCFPEADLTGKVFSETLAKDHTEDSEEAAKELYRKIRPGEPADAGIQQEAALRHVLRRPEVRPQQAWAATRSTPSSASSTDLDFRTLGTDDFVKTVHYLLRLKKYDTTRQDIGEIAPVRADDIDHLGNRRVRAVGELLENQFRIGLVRMERAIKEKMSRLPGNVDGHAARPDQRQAGHGGDPRVLRHRRSSRSSWTRPTRCPRSPTSAVCRPSDRAASAASAPASRCATCTPTHYGRICPIETPEGPNIGLISSLSCYARINEFGFIESPYRKVENGRIVHFAKVTSVGDSKFGYMDVVRLDDLEAENKKLTKAGKRAAKFEMHAFYLSAWEEDEHVIAQANVARGRRRRHPRRGRHRPRRRRTSRSSPATRSRSST